MKPKKLHQVMDFDLKLLKIFKTVCDCRSFSSAESILGISLEERRKYDEFGVLMRANTQSRFIEEAFLLNNIPYTMSGGTSFFERKEIKDVISYLRVISNHDDDINLLRIINTPHRGIGRAAIQLINDEAEKLNSTLWTAIISLIEAKDSTASEILKEDLKTFVDIIENNRTKLLSGHGLATKVRNLIEEINYKDHLLKEYSKSEKAVRFKMLNIESLLNSMETWEKDPDNFSPNLYNYLNRITLLSRDDMEDDNDKGKVNLMTIHASKGLEFPVVFIAGAEEGLIPHARSVEENGGDVEEERRLFYVAITRARDKLFISACRKRRHMQMIRETEPSRFLDEIPSNLVEYHQPKEITEDETHEMFSSFLNSLKSRL